jgi:uncharacterized membrane protein
LGKVFGWFFALFSLGLGALGVYLGRFSRFNSWDIFLEPKSVVKEISYNILNPVDNLGFVGFTLMFTSILLVFYLMFVTSSMQNIQHKMVSDKNNSSSFQVK